VITGESGAGKSIMLESLGLLLGNRANFGAIRIGEEKCTVEANFNGFGPELVSVLEEEKLDVFDDIIIRRELTFSGRSRAFINDTPVGLSVLKRIGTMLIDLHGQQENIALQSASFKCEQLDLFANNKVRNEAYQKVYREYRNLQAKIQKLKEASSQIRKDQDYIEFQLEELSVLDDYNADSIRDLESELTELEHASEILEVLNSATGMINDEEGIYSMLQKFSNRIKSIVKYKESFQQMDERVKSIIIEVKELGSEMEQISEDIEINPNRLEVVKDKLDTINRLLYKHGVGDFQSLQELTSGYREKLNGIESFEEELKEAEIQFEAIKKRAETLAQELTQARMNAREGLELAVIKQLNELGMPKAQLRFQINQTTELNSMGFDRVEMLFDANGNSNLLSIDEVASGGEIARLMLALKGLQSEGSQSVTLIFDEIDTGVSGEVAKRIGKLMNRLGANNQVIAVTHLPGVASKGHHHIRISKQEMNGRVNSIFENLSEEARIIELAGMFSGDSLTQAALDSAKSLLNADN